MPFEPGPRERLPLSLPILMFLLLAAGFPACNDGGTRPGDGGGNRLVYVPGTYDTVAEALREAQAGDSIFVELVAFEPFAETVVIAADQTPLALLGTKSRPQLLAPSDAVPLLRFRNPRPGTVIENVAFAGGNAAVEVDGGGELTIRRCLFTSGVVHVRAGGTAPSVRVEECISVGASLFGLEAGGDAELHAIRNTILKSGDCGVLVSGGAIAELRTNIIARAVNYGIACTGGGALADTSGCNDVWLAGQAPYLNCPPADGDIHENPLFCGEISGNYTLSELSPCTPLYSNGCGTIGALGIGCSPFESPGER